MDRSDQDPPVWLAVWVTISVAAVAPAFVPVPVLELLHVGIPDYITGSFVIGVISGIIAGLIGQGCGYLRPHGFADFMLGRSNFRFFARCFSITKQWLTGSSKEGRRRRR